MKKEAPRNYPYSAWILSAAYIPKPVTFVRPAWGIWGKIRDVTAEGKTFKLEQIHKTKKATIEYGRQQIVARSDYLAKQEKLLDARTAKLDKAEQEGA